MNFELLRVFVALVCCGLAAWQDAKTSFIDDKILWVMIIAGLFLNLLTLDVAFILPVALGALVIIGLGLLVYKLGQFGSGDVMLFLGLHLLLPFYPASLTNAFTALLPFFKIPFVLSLFLASSFFASVGSAAYYLYRLMAFRKALFMKIPLFMGLSALLCIIVFLAPLDVFARLFLVLILWSLLFNALFREEIMDLVVVRQIRVSEIEDEDILAIDRLPPELVKKYSIERVLTKAVVEKLKLVEKNEGLRVFPVCKSLPRFGPYVFAALLVCLAVGDLLVFAFLR